MARSAREWRAKPEPRVKPDVEQGRGLEMKLRELSPKKLVKIQT